MAGNVEGTLPASPHSWPLLKGKHMHLAYACQHYANSHLWALAPDGSKAKKILPSKPAKHMQYFTKDEILFSVQAQWVQERTTSEKCIYVACTALSIQAQLISVSGKSDCGHGKEMQLIYSCCTEPKASLPNLCATVKDGMLWPLCNSSIYNTPNSHPYLFHALHIHLDLFNKTGLYSEVTDTGTSITFYSQTRTCWKTAKVLPSINLSIKFFYSPMLTLKKGYLGRVAVHCGGKICLS